MKSKCKKFAVKRNQSYRSVIKTGASMRPVKLCAPRWTFYIISTNW